MNRWTLYPLERSIRARGHQTHNRTYRSSSFPLEVLADRLALTVERQLAAWQADTVDFVTHSMGGLLVRLLLRRHHVPQARRVVQIVPPNQGSMVARYFRDWPLFRFLYGPSGQQLAWGADRLERLLGLPEGVEFGVIGAQLRHRPRLLPVARPSDGVVHLDEMPLEGAAFRLLPSGHNTILLNRTMYREVGHFLEQGRFTEPESPLKSTAPASRAR